MFCAKCGQQQMSEDMRFCSRCGFGLRTTGTAESRLPTLVSLVVFIASLLAVGASLIYVGPAAHQMLTFSLIVAAIAFAFLLSCRPWRLIHRLLAQERAQQETLGSAQSEHALPPVQSIPVTEFEVKRVKTAEMAQPPSITEHTTRLLDSDRD